MADIDVVSDILSATLKAFPESGFIQSIAHQYLIRGWLSKKQLQGLYDKARKASDIPPGKMATLQAQIQKMPTRYKSDMPEPKALYEKDSRMEKLVSEILSKYPQHKRVLFLQTKLTNNQPLTPAESAEVEKFHKLLL